MFQLLQVILQIRKHNLWKSKKESMFFLSLSLSLSIHFTFLIIWSFSMEINGINLMLYGTFFLKIIIYIQTTEIKFELKIFSLISCKEDDCKLNHTQYDTECAYIERPIIQTHTNNLSFFSLFFFGGLRYCAGPTCWAV